MATPELIAGPYAAPACRAGDWLDDVVDGRLEVGGWTSAPISWPRRKKTGRPSLILTAELERAVRTESAEAICYWWGVRPTKVWMWRQALGVPRANEGTRKLLRERTGVPPEAAARGRERARLPDVIERMAQTKRGKPAHPNIRAALRAYALKPRAVFGPPAYRWTAREDAYLRRWHGRVQGHRIAEILGRSCKAVSMRVTTLGIGSPRWQAWEDDLLRRCYETTPGNDLAEILSRTRPSIYERARVLGLLRKRTKA